jgi:hypothetical protein
MNNYPYIFLDKDLNSMTYNEWCVRLDEFTSLDGYETEREAYEDAQHHIAVQRFLKEGL